MKTLYLECSMGASGDMLMAALLELHPNPNDFLAKLNSIGIPSVHVSSEPSVKCGISGTHITVKVNDKEELSFDHLHDHHERHNDDDHNHEDHFNHAHDHRHSDDHYKHADDHHHSHHHNHNHTHDHHNSYDYNHSHDHHHSHEHEHRTYHAIEHTISHLNVSAGVKKNILAVYTLIAQAESLAHKLPVEKIHFHEVGEMDAIADISGVCLLLEELAPDRIFASPVNTGFGYVRCSHGVLPVPAPATAHILRDVPIYSDETKGELCTPTGAALLKHFVQEFCTMPNLTVRTIGYGMGKKDFEKANCVRIFLGTSADTAGSHDNVTELTCNLDDMTPEAISFAQQILLDEGALDVWTLPIGMKKGRTGILFSCLCSNEAKDTMVHLMFKHTSTLGIRQTLHHRYILQRDEKKLPTQYGEVRVKNASGFGVKKSKPAYDDLARLAKEHNITLGDVTAVVKR